MGSRVLFFVVPCLGAAVVGGCFGPEFPQGVPCSIDGECPRPQICAFDNRCYDPSEVPIPNGDSSLASLEVAEGILEPPFDPAVTSYTVSLGLEATEVQVTATASTPADAIITINQSPAAAGTALVSLDFGDNLVEIEVSTSGGEPTTYRIVASRGGALLQEAYVKASNTDSDDNFGGNADLSFFGAVALAGNTMAIGAELEDSSATGVNGNQSDDSANSSGAVYVFVRNGGNWTQQAYLKASNTGGGDFFGSSVALSGETLVVGAPFEDSSAREVNGNQSDNNASSAGAAYMFTRNGTTWSQQAYLKASNAEPGDLFGRSVAILGDTVAVGARNESSGAIGVNGNQDDNGASGAGAAYVFTRAGTTWSQQAYIKASNTDANDFFGAAIALSEDTLAVGASSEDSNAVGINGNQGDNTATSAGAVYIYTRNGTVWSHQAYIKASNTDANDGFGASVALSEDTLLVGAPREDSSASEVDGEQGDDNLAAAGAAYVFTRNGTNWSQQAYLKASNADANDLFGSRLAVSGDVAVVTATDEASNSIGVNGSESDNSADEAGAAYVFTRQDTAWSQMAYLKPSNTRAEDSFGASVAVSNGTIAIGAPFEDSDATGVNGEQNADGAFDSGAVYVIR